MFVFLGQYPVIALTRLSQGFQGGIAEATHAPDWPMRAAWRPCLQYENKTRFTGGRYGHVAAVLALRRLGRRASAQGSAQADQSDGPGAVLIEAQLDRLLKSTAFEASTRNRNFLSYIINLTINGRRDRIKAYSIATEVFGRNQDFDAHSDPIVRIEAGHLRRALDHYYLTDGSRDDVVITVPKGWVCSNS